MGTKATDKNHRQRLRKRLEKAGYPPAEIDRLVAAKKLEQDALRRQDNKKAQRIAKKLEVQQLHAERDDIYESTYRRLQGDDRKYRPTRVDPITTGQGRATGLAAKAAKRGRSFTRFEYDQAQAGS